MPLTAVHAWARLAELRLATARLQLAIEVPTAMNGVTAQGVDRRQRFCRGIRQKADHLVNRAFHAARACLEQASGTAPALAGRCQRFLEPLASARAP